VIGPGILFAGTAIGVSHLVQATRAGAVYGLAMLLVLILVNALKYPAFRFAPHYVAVTGASLIDGYARRGRWVLVLYGLALLPTLATVVAAVAITLSGLAVATLGVDWPPALVGASLVGASVVSSLVGGFAWLDRLTKVFVAFLTLATLAAAVLAVPMIEWPGAALIPPVNAASLVFVVALAGYMPAGLDLSVMHSLWSVAKARQTGVHPTTREAAADFDIGFAASLVLAVCFLLMGAGVMHPAGVAPEPSAPAFAAQVIALYESTLGAWSGLLVGIAAILVLLTTLIAVTDGFPRVVAALVGKLLEPPGGDARPGGDAMAAPAARVAAPLERTAAYRIAMALIALGAVLLLLVFFGSFRAFIDTATTIGFLTSPVIALLNHLAVFGPDVTGADRPGRVLWAWSVVGIAAMTLFAVAYLLLPLLPPA
jgi:Mn2+/Fe2+ NRAMP family transporter